MTPTDLDPTCAVVDSVATSAEPDDLPDDQEWWTPSDLAARLGLTPNAITYHCRRLFPEHAWRNRYRLSRDQAVRVFRYVRKFGAKQNSSQNLKREAEHTSQQAPEQKV